MSRVRYPLGNFPFLVPHVHPAAVGARTLYPAGFSLDEAMHLFWVTRKYQFAATCSAVLIGNGAFDYSETLECGGYMNVYDYSSDPALATDENIMPALSTADFTGEAVSNYGAYFSVLFAGAGIWRFPNATVYPPLPRMVLCTDTGLYHPLMGISLYYRQLYEPHPSTMRFNSYAGYVNPLEVGYQFESLESHFNFFGQTVPVIAYRSNAGITGSCGGGISSEGYWRYADRDGLTPLYSESDGTVAMNPATGQPYTREEIIAAPWS